MQEVQTPQRPQLSIEELRQQRQAINEEADHVYRKWTQLRTDVSSKQIELDAAAAALDGVQPSGLSDGLKSYSNLLLQVTGQAGAPRAETPRSKTSSDCVQY